METEKEIKNPYAMAWDYQNEMIRIDQQIQDLNAERSRFEALYENAINAGQGKLSIDGYNLITETKTTEKRTIKMEAIRKLKPEILTTVGIYPANFAARFLTPKQRIKMITDPDFETNYKIGLGELDKAVGGKKNAAPFVDVEISARETKRISRIESPIIEV